MIELIKNWIISVTAVSCAAAIAWSLIPQGPVRRAARLAVGLALFAALTGPLATIEPDELALSDDVSWELDASGFEKTNARLREELIEDGCEAYILDKADLLGAELRAVSVECRAEDGLPVSVSLKGEFSPELSEYIERELGVKEESQQWG